MTVAAVRLPALGSLCHHAVMHGRRNRQKDPLLAGFFTTPEVARLVGASQPKIRGWLNGYPNSSVGPIVDRDFKGSKTISFLDLMEVRFIQCFRAAGVPAQTIRRAVEEAGKQWGVSHPLALYNETYVTDRRNIFAQVAEEDNDRVTWDMATGQLEMWTVIEETIAKGVRFDPSEYRAQSWTPRPGEFDDVIIDPRIAFGRAIVSGTRVPTSVLFGQWMTERSKERVAKWFNVTQEAVATAIGFEFALAS